MSEKIEPENKELSKIDLIHHLINQGTICYISKKFDFGQFIDKIMDWMLTSLALEAQYNKNENVHRIIFKNRGGVKDTLGLNMSFALLILDDQTKIYFDLKPEKWLENENSKLSLSKLITDSHADEINSFIFNYLFSLNSSVSKIKIDTRNHYIEKISNQQKSWFYAQMPEEDVLLAFLEISSVKKDNGLLKKEKAIKWYIFLSSGQIGLIAFNGLDHMVQHVEINPTEFKVRNELGRNPIFFNDFKLLSKRSNADLFYHVQHLATMVPDEKVREIARLNWILQEKNEESNQFAIAIQQFLFEQSKDSFDELSLIYMEYTSGNREKVFSKYTEDEKLIKLLHQILEHKDTFELLTQWVKKWGISYIDLVALNNLLIKSMENAVQANNILPFHRYVRENFFKKNKDILNETIFDIGFCKHLIKCGLGKEAKKILQKRLDQLPDETVSDILPAKNIDLTGPAAGQIIKVSMLEILSELETQKEANATKCQIARLQPLVDERIEELIKLSEPTIVNKGKELKSIMLPEGLIVKNQNNPDYKYKSLGLDFVDKNLRHPASRKNGSFSNFQKWLATVKIPDLSMLKSYTEKLSPQKYPGLSAIITDIKYALNLENIEVYISHGDKSVGITSFESNPQFLIVGGDHLDNASPHFLKYTELRFAIAVELAHLFFKHARITSSDIWKGAFEKGYFVVDAILSIFPAVGMFSKSLQSLGKLNEISSYLQKTEKLGKVSSKSRDIVKNSEQIINLYKSKFSKDKKDNGMEMEFLATSRIMQLTAHRSALIFTKDLKSAIRAMFLVSKRYYTELPLVEKYGLKDFLLKKDEQGNYTHQELAIRLADLFSFYLSDEYENVIKTLES